VQRLLELVVSSFPTSLVSETWFRSRQPNNSLVLGNILHSIWDRKDEANARAVVYYIRRFGRTVRVRAEIRPFHLPYLQYITARKRLQGGQELPVEATAQSRSEGLI
jgi:hypothetical protein